MYLSSHQLQNVLKDLKEMIQVKFHGMHSKAKYIGFIIIIQYDFYINNLTGK